MGTGSASRRQREREGTRVSAAVPSAGVPTCDRPGFLGAHPALVRYARALIALELDEVHAISIADRTWWSLGIRRRPARDAATVADVTCTVIQPPYQLTARELDTLTLVAAGFHNAEIATRLGASRRTVATHIERILGKLDQSTRSGAAAVAAEQALLRLPVPGGGRGAEGLAVGLLEETATRGVRPHLRRQRSVRHVSRAKRAPIVLGSAYPITGSSAADGEDMRRGAALAIAELNARGGVGGRQIEHVVVDVDASCPDAAPGAIDALAAAGADAITFGYIHTREAIPRLLERAADYGAPFLHTLTSRTASDIVRDDRTHLAPVFQACSPEDLYANGFLRFLAELDARGTWPPDRRRIAFVEPRDVATAPPQALDRAERAGWTISDVLRVDAARPASWPEAARHVRDAGADAVMVSCFVAEDLLRFLRVFRANGCDTLLYATYTPSVPGFAERAGPMADGLVWSTLVGVYADAFAQAFARRFRTAFGVAPGRSNAGIQYDLVHLLAQGWTSSEGPRPFERVCSALRSTIYRGVTGAYYLGTPGQSGLSFPDESPDPSIATAHLVLQIQGGRHVIVAPSAYADGSFRAPAWMSRRHGRFTTVATSA